jgi:hypothetical protein
MSREPLASTRRARIAHVFASVALLAALIGALGPADKVRTTYSWPPRTLPAGKPTRVWYTPLLLIRRVPEAISATLPCSLPPALPAAARPTTILATAHFPEENDGLAVLRTGDQLVVKVGARVLDRVRVADNGACAWNLSLGGGRWSLEGGAEHAALEGPLETMPIVNGLFSALDLRSGTPPSIKVRTAIQATRTTPRQALAWTIAAVFAVAALLLVAVERRPRRPWAAATTAARSAFARARAADAVVLAVLLGWWLVAPAIYDDGWVLARVLGYSSSGGFSNYYDSLGANLPLEFWLDWSNHWLTKVSSTLVVLRIPVLVCLAATWVLCRWILARVLGSSASEGAVLWALATTFLVGALASGLSLRTEPQVALLAAGVLACTMRFLERESAAPLAVAAALVALALSVHPAGIVSVAPLLVTAPRVFRWIRGHPTVAASIFTAAAALIVFLVVVGSDLAQRSADTNTLRTYGQEGADWRVEIFRYSNLLIPYYGTPLRRESVALIGLALLAYLFRKRRQGAVLLDLPTSALAVSLLLLIATPAKLPFHFGTLIGLAAVAVAAETARLRDERERSRGWSARPFLAIGAATLAAAWSWTPRLFWNDLDLRTLDWTLGFESRIGLSNLAVAVPLVLLLGTGFVQLLRGRRSHLDRVPWSVVSWTAPALAIPLIVFTIGVLVADAAKTDSWTLARQNVEALDGDPGCGLADSALVAAPASMKPLPSSRPPVAAPSAARWSPSPPIGGLPRLTLGPVGQRPVASPWFDLPRGRGFGLFVAGQLSTSNGLALEWGFRRRGRIHSFESDVVSTRIASESQPEIVTWRFLAAADLPSPTRGAQVVRIVLRDLAGAAVAVSPVTYSNEALTQRLSSSGLPSLVVPGLFTYFHCARLPRLHDGVAEVPGEVVGLRGTGWPVLGRTTTPFDGLLDLYRVNRYPLTDSPERTGDVVVYEIDRRIPGAATASPETARVVS